MPPVKTNKINVETGLHRTTLMLLLFSINIKTRNKR